MDDSSPVLVAFGTCNISVAPSTTEPPGCPGSPQCGGRTIQQQTLPLTLCFFSPAAAACAPGRSALPGTAGWSLQGESKKPHMATTRGSQSADRRSRPAVGDLHC